MNDPVFWLFLGLTVFAVIYAGIVIYLVRHDSSRRPAKSSRKL